MVPISFGAGFLGGLGFDALGIPLPYLLGSLCACALLSLVGAVFVQHRTGLDANTSFFAAVIGGASDMAHQAAQAGGRGDLVALAHTIRVSLVVGITPFLALWFSNSGDAVTGSPGLESNGFVCP